MYTFLVEVRQTLVIVAESEDQILDTITGVFSVTQDNNPDPKLPRVDLTQLE